MPGSIEGTDNVDVVEHVSTNSFFILLASKILFPLLMEHRQLIRFRSCFKRFRLVLWLLAFLGVGTCILEEWNPVFFFLNWACWIRLDLGALILPLLQHVLITEDVILWLAIRCFESWLFLGIYCWSHALWQFPMLIHI